MPGWQDHPSESGWILWRVHKACVGSWRIPVDTQGTRIQFSKRLISCIIQLHQCYTAISHLKIGPWDKCEVNSLPCNILILLIGHGKILWIHMIHKSHTWLPKADDRWSNFCCCATKLFCLPWKVVQHKLHNQVTISYKTAGDIPYVGQTIEKLIWWNHRCGKVMWPQIQMRFYKNEFWVGF